MALVGPEGKEIMASAVSSWAVALDGGMTNARARLIRDGRIVATARRAVGVRDAVLSAGAVPLAAAVREALDDVYRIVDDVRPDLIVAAGMLSSEFGRTAVPHVVAPAGLDNLGRGGPLAPRHLRPADRVHPGGPHPGRTRPGRVSG
jgi:2-keto-3-deoxy-galactonokinase